MTWPDRTQRNLYKTIIVCWVLLIAVALIGLSAWLGSLS